MGNVPVEKATPWCQCLLPDETTNFENEEVDVNDREGLRLAPGFGAPGFEDTTPAELPAVKSPAVFPATREKAGRGEGVARHAMVDEELVIRRPKVKAAPKHARSPDGRKPMRSAECQKCEKPFILEGPPNASPDAMLEFRCPHCGAVNRMVVPQLPKPPDAVEAPRDVPDSLPSSVRLNSLALDETRGAKEPTITL
jgi:phage FluMu protein Com